MCGIAGSINWPDSKNLVRRMLKETEHRGPDNQSVETYSHEENKVVFGHNRLSIIDLSSEANQPMTSGEGRFKMVFNGEVYNYKELRAKLSSKYVFHTKSDTEVIMAAFEEWGHRCLDHFIGMFALAIWDGHKQELFLARDRFGVKPLYYVQSEKGLVFSSEIKALQVEGAVRRSPNEKVWKEYFLNARYDHTDELFWNDIKKMSPGSYLIFKQGRIREYKKWYDISQKIKSFEGDKEAAKDALAQVLEDSIKLRFRADVPIGICLSGGLDSSLLVSLVQGLKGNEFELNAFTFYTGNSDYDELPWVEKIMERTNFKMHKCFLSHEEVPTLTESIAKAMDEPFGGIPTLGMTKVFQSAKAQGVKVLLDGNGMDEGWGGYDYYRQASLVDPNKGPIQQSSRRAVMSSSLSTNFLNLPNLSQVPAFHDDPLLNLQIRDLSSSKIPRSMRFADRNSMLQSIELREPFLDHRLIELGISMPASLKLDENQGKLLVREVSERYLSGKIRLAPKRGVQTPQREWFQDELKAWVEERLEILFSGPYRDWFNVDQCLGLWQKYLQNEYDNSFFIWQWINASYLLKK